MTRLIQFANNATSRLAANLSAVGLTITLVPGEGGKFPALTGSQVFFGTLVRADGTKEVVKVTARSTDTLTIVRAVEPVGGVQTAYSFTAGDKFELRMTAGSLASELDRLDAAAFLNTVTKTANYVITEADVCELIKCDTTAGGITLTLPQISTLTGSFEVQVLKVTSDTNVVTISRAGTDTINGSTTYPLSAQYQWVWFVADLVTNAWTAVTSAPGNHVVDQFTGAGAAGPFTLSGSPGSKNNTAVFVGGVYQEKSTYTLAGTSLTLGGTVGVGVLVECVWTQPLTIGTPSDGTVTDAKVAMNAAIQATKLSFIQSGTGAVVRTVQDVLREKVSVLDFASLVYTATARSPGDPASHLLSSFQCWDAAIQAALDHAYAQGGGVVVLPKNTVPYYVRDTITVKSNTTFICEDWIVLADYNFTGGTFGANGDNILVLNLKIDNSGIYAGGSGYNGIGAAGSNVKFIGGHIKNCAKGVGGPADGGKGSQIEAGDSYDITVDGITFENCFMAMSTIRDFGTTNPYNGIIYNNIVAFNCQILFFVRQANGAQSQTGLQHTVQLNNFYARNCGAYEGVFQFSRASNVRISNGIVVNDPGSVTTSLIRGNHANSAFHNIGFYGDTHAIINLDPGTYSPDSSQANQNNSYEIDHWGTVDVIADANIATIYRTLNGCTGKISMRNTPATAFFGYELRNGSSMFQLTYGQKTVITNTNTGFNGASGTLTNFAGADTGITHAVLGVRFDGGASADPKVLDWYQEATWTPTVIADTGSGGTFTTSGRYTRVGRMVTVHGTISCTGSLGTLSGRIGISGLPFVADGAGPYYGTANITFMTLAASTSVAAAIGTVSNSAVYFPWTSNAGGGGDSVRISNLATNSSFYFSVVYFV